MRDSLATRVWRRHTIVAIGSRGSNFGGHLGTRQDCDELDRNRIRRSCRASALILSALKGGRALKTPQQGGLWKLICGKAKQSQCS